MAFGIRRGCTGASNALPNNEEPLTSVESGRGGRLLCLARSAADERGFTPQ